MAIASKHLVDMAVNAPPEVYSEARSLMRQRLRAMPWFPRMSAAARRQAIEADAERYWPLMISEAIERLLCQRAEGPDEPAERPAFPSLRLAS
jgi:hypothetical protein